MRKGLPEVRSLACTLLDHQSAGHGREARMAALERVLERLYDRVSLLVGSGGFSLLLQRALKRTRGEHAWLDGIRVGSETPWRLPGFGEAARDRSPEEAALAAQAILAELIGLVARFLGADMAIRLVRQSFPELAPEGHTGAGPEETTE